MANSRVRRGRKTQNELAEPEPDKGLGWFNRNGWPEAEAIAASLPGRDIRKMPGLAPEVKATANEPGSTAMKQAVKNAGGDLPFLIYRPKGYGPEKIGDWLVTFRLSDATELLRKAGYGE